MDELIKYTLLFDIYKSLLSDKQRSTFKDYYFENLTIEEIAKNNHVSKNAISKMLKTIKVSLDEYEEKLHFLEYLQSLQREFKNEKRILNRIDKYDNIIM